MLMVEIIFVNCRATAVSLCLIKPLFDLLASYMIPAGMQIDPCNK